MSAEDIKPDSKTTPDNVSDSFSFSTHRGKTTFQYIDSQTGEEMNIKASNHSKNIRMEQTEKDEDGKEQTNVTTIKKGKNQKISIEQHTFDENGQESSVFLLNSKNGKRKSQMSLAMIDNRGDSDISDMEDQIYTQEVHNYKNGNLKSFRAGNYVNDETYKKLKTQAEEWYKDDDAGEDAAYIKGVMTSGEQIAVSCNKDGSAASCELIDGDGHREKITYNKDSSFTYEEADYSDGSPKYTPKYGVREDDLRTIRQDYDNEGHLVGYKLEEKDYNKYNNQELITTDEAQIKYNNDGAVAEITINKYEHTRSVLPADEAQQNEVSTAKTKYGFNYDTEKKLSTLTISEESQYHDKQSGDKQKTDGKVLYDVKNNTYTVDGTISADLRIELDDMQKNGVSADKILGKISDYPNLEEQAEIRKDAEDNRKNIEVIAQSKFNLGSENFANLSSILQDEPTNTSPQIPEAKADTNAKADIEPKQNITIERRQDIETNKTFSSEVEKHDDKITRIDYQESRKSSQLNSNRTNENIAELKGDIKTVKANYQFGYDEAGNVNSVTGLVTFEQNGKVTAQYQNEIVGDVELNQQVQQVLESGKEPSLMVREITTAVQEATRENSNASKSNDVARTKTKQTMLSDADAAHNVMNNLDGIEKSPTNITNDVARTETKQTMLNDADAAHNVINTLDETQKAQNRVNTGNTATIDTSRSGQNVTQNNTTDATQNTISIAYLQKMRGR